MTNEEFNKLEVICKDHVKFNDSEIISESLKQLRPELREVVCQVVQWLMLVHFQIVLVFLQKNALTSKK